MRWPNPATRLTSEEFRWFTKHQHAGRLWALRFFWRPCRNLYWRMASLKPRRGQLRSSSPGRRLRPTARPRQPETPHRTSSRPPSLSICRRARNHLTCKRSWPARRPRRPLRGGNQDRTPDKSLRRDPAVLPCCSRNPGRRRPHPPLGCRRSITLHGRCCRPTHNRLR